MSDNEPVPYMRLTSDVRSLARRVKRGMTIEQVREIWRERSEAKTKEIMEKYYKQRPFSGGREGLGIYGQFQSRAATEKVRLAERLAKSVGLPLNDATIRKIMRR
ncbi:MAG: hypothetical protein JWN40_3581 [Phycisphaerales bacterium]|nr:hypothetical protein [Phycisphaerales bacterium]